MAAKLEAAHAHYHLLVESGVSNPPISLILNHGAIAKFDDHGKRITDADRAEDR